jgi:radical SAM protein with 4Fe4S-binding SPASM domain
MTYATFERVLNEVAPYGDHLYFHVKGEPTLHPELERFLDRASQYHKKVHLVTNGTLLQHLDFDLGAHPALASLVISLHSLQELPEIAQDAILSDLTLFIKQNRLRPFTFYLRLWNHDNGKLVDWLSGMLGFQVVYSPTKQRQKLVDNLVLDTDQAFEWPDMSHPEVSYQGTCYGGLKMMAVLSDGTVTPCCLDHNGLMAIGNLLTTPLTTLLNQPRYQSFRTSLQQNHFTEALCQRCTYHLKHKKRISR